MKSAVKWGIVALVGVILAALGFGLGFGAFPVIIDNQIKATLDLWDLESEGRKNFVSSTLHTAVFCINMIE